MITLKHLTCVLPLYIFCLCEPHSDNHIVVGSLDGNQVKKIEVGKSEVFKNCKLDRHSLDSKISKYELNVWNLTNDITKCEDSSFVFLIKNKETGREGEVTILLLGEMKEKLKALHYIEVEQGKWYWRMKEDTSNVVNVSEKKIQIDVLLKSIGFALSGIINFPLNKEGTYSNEPRYMRLRLQFQID